MTKHLLLSGAVLCALMAQAETKFYTSNELGIVGGISNNGRYAAVFDDENSLGYLWDAENPEEFTLVKGFQSSKVMLYDVSDNGIAVGAYYLGGCYYPCFVKDGEVEALELSPYALYTNEARCISADGKIIGGYQMYKDPTAETGGRNRPCLWTLNEDSGEYELYIYADIELPEHQGFITNCMSDDGRVIGGRLYCAAGSEIPAIVKDGELIYWAELETRLEPFMYKDKILGYYEEYYIDGYHDGAMKTEPNFVTGEFSNIDAWGNLYGFRSHIEDLAEDGQSCRIVNYACVYNYENDEWTEAPTSGGIRSYLTGLNGQYIFGNGNNVLVSDNDSEERKNTVTGEFDFTSNRGITGVFRTSVDGKVLGGCTQEMNPATGEYQYFPFVVVLDEPLVDAPSSVEIIPAAKNLAVVLSAGRIDIAGAEGTVYDLDGRMIGTGTSFQVAPGTYVVKSGEASCKVLVK